MLDNSSLSEYYLGLNSTSSQLVSFFFETLAMAKKARVKNDAVKSVAKNNTGLKKHMVKNDTGSKKSLKKCMVKNDTSSKKGLKKGLKKNIKDEDYSTNSNKPIFAEMKHTGKQCTITNATKSTKQKSLTILYPILFSVCFYTLYISPSLYLPHPYLSHLQFLYVYFKLL